VVTSHISPFYLFSRLAAHRSSSPAGRSYHMRGLERGRHASMNALTYFLSTLHWLRFDTRYALDRWTSRHAECGRGRHRRTRYVSLPPSRRHWIGFGSCSVSNRKTFQRGISVGEGGKEEPVMPPSLLLDATEWNTVALVSLAGSRLDDRTCGEVM
jgi:hypothetical protein